MHRALHHVLRLGLPCLVLLLPIAIAWGQFIPPGERGAPNGIVTPQRGPFAGKPCQYGDGSGEFTRMAGFKLADLEEFIAGKKKPPGLSHVGDFIWAMKNREYSYGSQLSLEGYERYKELVRECLEDGKSTEGKTGCRHRTSRPIGIHIQTGKPTAEYVVILSRGYWIVEPGWLK